MKEKLEHYNKKLQIKMKLENDICDLINTSLGDINIMETVGLLEKIKFDLMVQATKAAQKYNIGTDSPDSDRSIG